MPPTRFSQQVLDWYDAHGRQDLPWKRPATPYRVWVSEIMLQQTQVNTVIPYFQRFLAAFPDVKTLAQASLDQVLGLWAGLGYYARARNLHRAAALIQAEHGGRFPADLAALTALPGIGRSTAGAILSLAMGQSQAILDGNVKRVLARYHAVPGWPGHSAVTKRLWGLAEDHTPRRRTGDYNQAMMDLGATVCTRRPACPICPLAEGCAARAEGEPGRYPAPKPRKTLPVRRTRMVMVQGEDGLLLQRRPPAGIWGGLWSLPECPDQEALGEWAQRELGQAVHCLEQWTPLRHTFSHFHLDITPVLARAENPTARVMDRPDLVWYNSRSQEALGLPAPVRTLVDKFQQIRGETHDENGSLRQVGQRG